MLLGLATIACGRTDLGLPTESGEFYGDVPDIGVDAGEDVELPIAEEDAGQDSGSAIENGCVPTEETCNGIDDDCDGDVDEVPPIPCPNGGERYCVAGRMSKCPTRCEVCIPGSERVCQLSYCTYWGVQTCAADGMGFGVCREEKAPPECIDVAKEHQKSSELERCCIDNDYCCLDLHDLDDDGKRSDVLGRCDEVLCE